jgi:hypothetical protein
MSVSASRVDTSSFGRNREALRPGHRNRRRRNSECDPERGRGAERGALKPPFPHAGITTCQLSILAPPDHSSVTQPSLALLTALMYL